MKVFCKVIAQLYKGISTSIYFFYICFSFLSDKCRRSYDDVFNGLASALKKRDLELSAEYFMADFETNIRDSFTNVFPEISVKGCQFHFAKAIWSRVKKSGFQTYYSIRSTEPKFGSFVRAVLGLPFVKIDELDRGMKNVEKLSNMICDVNCKKFAKDMIGYLNSQWIHGAIDPKIWNMFLHKGARTNNNCEGYNYKLNSKTKLKKHPNPYLLAAVIRDELIISQDNAMGKIQLALVLYMYIAHIGSMKNTLFLQM